MTPSKLVLLIAAPVLMIGICIGVTGVETWLTGFGTSLQAQQTLGRIGLALPYVIAAVIGVIFLFAARGAVAIRSGGLGVLTGSVGVIAIAAIREFGRLNGFASSVPDGHSILEYADPATGIGAVVCFVTGMFALRVALRGDAAFATMKPRRVSGKRAIHGSADWMPMTEAKRMFGEDGGIVIGEAFPMASMSL